MFVDFSYYVNEGVEQLGTSKLTPLLRHNYHVSIVAAVDDFGPRDGNQQGVHQFSAIFGSGGGCGVTGLCSFM